MTTTAAEPRGTVLRDAMVATILAVAVGLPVFLATDMNGPTIGSDGAKYVQSAANLLAGRGLMHSPHGPYPYEDVLEPLRLWPPGFPLAIAAVSSISHQDPAAVAIWLARLSWLLAPALMIVCLAPLDLGGWSVGVALLAVVSPGMLGAANEVRSDLPFLILVLVCFTCTFRALRGNHAWTWMAFAGLAAGLGVAVRNAGIAVLASVPTGLVLANRRSSPVPRQQTVVLIAGFSIGAILPIGALLVRNVAVFGQLQPYGMEPSTLGVLTNIRMLLYASLWESSASMKVAPIAWNAPAFVALVGLGVAGIVLMSGGWQKWCALIQTHRRQELFLLAVYGVSAAALMVYTRSKYELGDLINPRYAFQFTWICLAAIAVVGKDLWPLGWPRRAIIVVGVSYLIVARAAMVAGYFHPDPQRVSSLELTHRKQFTAALETVAQDSLVLSDDGPLLTAASGAGIRKIYAKPSSGRSNPYAEELLTHKTAIGGRRGLCFVDVSLAELARVADDVPEGFYLVARDPSFVALCSLPVRDSYHNFEKATRPR